MSQKEISSELGISARRERAERILDAAAELLQRHGYKRVTIDDVAERAEVGKGTVYQHWKTRDDLFEAVLQREYAIAMDEILAALHKDPESVLLHNAIQVEFRAVMHQPLLRAIFTADMDMLGKLLKGGFDRALEAQQDEVFKDYLKLLSEHHLIRSDLPVDEIFYAVSAATMGFFLMIPFSLETYPISAERQAELLATTVRHAFEPAAHPSSEVIQEVAARVNNLLTELAEDYQIQFRKAYE